MVMVSVEFGGLPELVRAVENYRDNINILYGCQDQLTLTLERVLCNIVVAMYSRYINLWPVSGTCVGHRSLLMYSMLEFAMHIGRYCRHERQLTRHQRVLIDPLDPRLTVKALVKDPEENQRSDEMEGFYLGTDAILYAELVSMAQYYDLMVAGSRHIGYLPECPSCKTPEAVAELFLQEWGQLLNKIRSYLENCKVECGIVVPTCLRIPVLILDSKECMRRYHKPELQGAFPTQFPIEGFGFVQPRNDLRRSIIPPNFRTLPTRVAAAMTTLIREDTLAADAADTENNFPLRGLPPLLASPHVTSTTAPHRDRRPSDGAESSDTENARRMGELSMDEAKCLLVWQLVSCQGHSHLRCPMAQLCTCSPAKETYNGDYEMASPRRSVCMGNVSITDAKRNLASAWAHVPPEIPPLMSLLTQPVPLCPHPATDIGQLTGCQLDANRQSRRDTPKRAPSPAGQRHTKKARTPLTEEDEETDDLVRQSQQECQWWEHSRAHSKSQNRRRRRAKSQARTLAAEATSTKESFIPVGYENTRREELQQEARRKREQACKVQAQEHQQRGAEKVAEMEEKLKNEVLHNQRNYMDHVT